MLSLLERPSWPALFRRVALISLIVHLVVAERSRGFYHCDEHYQVIEFLNAKLGGTPTSELAWEYGAHIRPWFQPALYYPFAKAALLLGIDEPFALSFVLRTLSALFGWAALVAFARCLPRFFAEGKARRLSLLGLHFFHLVPTLAARTSSENFSQSFLLFALALLIEPGRVGASFYPSGTEAAVRWFEPSALLAGAAFGCSFLSRYQAAALVFGACLWFCWFGRARARFVVGAGSALCVVLLLGVVIDRWGYGRWVYAPWDYFRVNLVEGVAAKLSRSPPWGYLTLFTAKLVPPFGLLWLLVLVLSPFLLPRHLLTFTVTPFVLLHHALSHKEARFLFPTLDLALVLAGLLVVRAGELLAQRRGVHGSRSGRRLSYAFGVLLLVLNLIGFFVFAFVPITPRWTILRELDQLAPAGYTLYTGTGYDAITTCNANPVFYKGKRQYVPYREDEPIRGRDARGLPAYYAVKGTPLTVHQNPFHGRCRELFPTFWLRAFDSGGGPPPPVVSSLARDITTYAVYACGDAPAEK